MNLYEMTNEAESRRQTLLQEAQQARLARIARQAQNAQPQPKLVQRLTASFASVKLSVSGEPQETANRVSASA